MKTMDGLDEYLVTGKSLLTAVRFTHPLAERAISATLYSQHLLVELTVVCNSRLGPHRLPVMWRAEKLVRGGLSQGCSILGSRL